MHHTRFAYRGALLLVTVTQLCAACSSAKLASPQTGETLPTHTAVNPTLAPLSPTSEPHSIATPVATPTQASSPSPEATSAPPTTTLVVTSDPIPEVSDQVEISVKDNGRTFTYKVTGRFMVFLDRTTYPENEYTCTPEGITAWVSNASGLYSPELNLTSVGFEGVQPGVCVLTNGDFSITIRIVDWQR